MNLSEGNDRRLMTDESQVYWQQRALVAENKVQSLRRLIQVYQQQLIDYQNALSRLRRSKER
jgi:hypothetical protein